MLQRRARRAALTQGVVLPRICLLGAECTGKTTLAQALAQHFNALVVPEALRLFCQRHERTPTQAEQPSLIDVQLACEDAALTSAQARGKRWLICDTAPLMTAVYSEHYFADTTLYARALQLHSRYALTLWLQPDLPWVADDAWRDGLAVRMQVHTLLARAMQAVAPVAVIAGEGALRFDCAVAAIRSM